MALVESTDWELVEAHKSGDADAFAAIVEFHQRSLFSHALRRLGDRAAAEDAVQETLLRAYRALPRFNGQYRLGGWLHRILENVCADEGNRRKRESVLVERLEGGEQAPTPAPDTNPPVDIESAVNALPPAYREALYLRYVEGMPYRTVAEMTGVSEENARARVHRARAALRRMLAAAVAVWATLLAMLRRPSRALAETSVGQANAQAAAAAAQLPPTVTELALTVAAAPDRVAVVAKVAAAVVAVALPVASVGMATGTPAPGAGRDAQVSAAETPRMPEYAEAGAAPTLSIVVASEEPAGATKFGEADSSSPDETASPATDSRPERAPEPAPESAPPTNETAPSTRNDSADGGASPAEPAGSTATSSDDASEDDTEAKPTRKIDLPTPKLSHPSTGSGRSDLTGATTLTIGGLSLPGRLSLTVSATSSDPREPQRLAGSFVGDAFADGRRVRLRFYGSLSEVRQGDDDTVVHVFTGTYRNYGDTVDGLPAKGDFTARYTFRTDGGPLALVVEVRPAVRAPAGAEIQA